MIERCTTSSATVFILGRNEVGIGRSNSLNKAVYVSTGQTVAEQRTQRTANRLNPPPHPPTMGAHTDSLVSLAISLLCTEKTQHLTLLCSQVPPGEVAASAITIQHPLFQDKHSLPLDRPPLLRDQRHPLRPRRPLRRPSHALSNGPGALLQIQQGLGCGHLLL